ncbi:hypothetical protein V6N12_027087 [Hibiscus sabdariffa]|uniref:Uncharacterized protein n=1 Tax=Hibiscus sabdariffa TaxID=183260 RepID=A0ABR2DTP1_9ROSI
MSVFGFGLSDLNIIGLGRYLILLERLGALGSGVALVLSGRRFIMVSVGIFAMGVLRTSGLIHDNILQRIVVIRPPHPSLSSDVPAWRWSDNQLFSSKLAYEKITESEDWIHHTDWNVIWQKGVDTLLSKSDRLLTNKEQTRRHLTNSLLCPVCHTEEETVEMCYALARLRQLCGIDLSDPRNYWNS